MATAKTPNTDDQIALFQSKEAPNAFKKAVEVIHSKPLAPMSLLQGKILNQWLQKAATTAPDAEGWWTLRIDKMSSAIGFNSNNRPYLKESALALMRIVFAWDVLSPEDKRVKWKASVLFPDVEILRDVIKFKIGSQLQDHIRNPAIYALIDQTVTRKYKRVASRGIYEHCMRFHRIGHTATVEWREFRDMILGVASKKNTPYLEYKHFKQKCLNPAIAEVNAEGTIRIELHETKAGRSIEGLFFNVQRPQVVLDEVEIEDDAYKDLLGRMMTLGIPPSEAKRLLRQHLSDEIGQAIDYTNDRKDSKKAEKLENPAAYFRKALAQKWVLSPKVMDVEVKRMTTPESKSYEPMDIETLYRASLVTRAEQYFNELEPDEQTPFIERYNESQPVAALKLKTKSTKGSQAAFMRWLARELWGEVTPEQLLSFAQGVINQSQRT
jgi:Initiator Replication protein